MALCVAMLIASEFMPVSLLTPIAADLRATEGMAGQAISVSGLFAVVTSLFIATIAGRFDRRYVHPTLIAKLYAHAGEKDRALDWLERAYAERDSQLIFLPLAGWDSLRTEPRLQALLRRMNLPR